MKKAPILALLFLGVLAQLLGCGGGAPCVPVDDGNPCTVDVCENGVPVHHPSPAGSECSTGVAKCDGMGSCVGCLAPTDCPGTDDACQARTCQAGTCGLSFTVAGTPLAAQTPHDCQKAVCDGLGKVASVADDGDLPLDDGNACTDEVCVAGAPGHPAKADGTPCSDGDACTQTDTCQAGTCTGGNPVVCAPLDPCHLAGVCDPANGMCSSPPAADGTACDDGNACTQLDTCQAGACTGGSPVVCVALDPCHAAGICDPSSGTCSKPAKADGTACDDGDACTLGDACQAGACTGAAQVMCGPIDQCHLAGVCNPANGTCSSPAKANGAACDDGNACTQTDICVAGVCSGGAPVVCPAPGQCRLPGVCNPATGTCSSPAVANGTACTNSNPCTVNSTCQAGACAGGAPKMCFPLDQCHVAGVCDAISGCSNPVAVDGKACNDGDLCTQTDVCSAGVCTGGNPVVCPAPNPCLLASTCTPATGTCPALSDGTPCDDANICTVGDSCQGGACTSGVAVVCSGGATCAPGACAPPTTTWSDCGVGLDPTKNGGDLMWEEQAQFSFGSSPGVLGPFALGPTGDIALGASASSPGAGAGYGTAAYLRLNGSGSLFVEGYYQAIGYGASTSIGWNSLAVASNNDFLLSIGGTVGCGASPPNVCANPVVSFYHQGAPSTGNGSGTLPCSSGGPFPLGYCSETIDDTLTPTGQYTTPLVGIPDGAGGTYQSGALYVTTDFGCGPMAPTASPSGYLVHLGPGSSCVYSRVFPVVASVVADANGAIVSASSTTSLDLGCGLLAAAGGGSTFVTHLDPAGSCVFGKSLPAPGLTVVLDPNGRAVVSGLVGPSPVDLGGGPLAPLGSQDAVLAELDAAGNYLWGKRFGGPLLGSAHVSTTPAGNVYLRTGWSGSAHLGGGVITAASNDTVVGSYTSAGAHRWSRKFHVTGSYQAGIDGCGALVLASDDGTFNPGTGKILQPFPSHVTVAVVRYAP